MKRPCVGAAYCALMMAFSLVILSAAFGASALSAGEKSSLPDWSEIREVKLTGGLKIFWNIVGAPDRDLSEPEVVAHGFERVDLLNTYSDYPGKQREKITPDGKNPWNKPPFFERIIRRNVSAMRGLSIRNRGAEMCP